MNEPEPCMCGADDCRRCYPANWRESCVDEDAQREEAEQNDRLTGE